MTVIQFRRSKQKTAIKTIRSVDGIKYYSEKQIRLLRRTVRDKAERGTLTAVREWAAIDLLTCTGLRVSEVVNLRCSDIKAGYGESSIFVRNGKGGISGTVQIPEALKRHLKQFISWKQDQGESTGLDDYLFIGQRGPWTVQAVQQMVKKYLRQLGLYENGKSVHSLRHSYAVQLYSQDHDLRTVQKQLRHRSIRSTQVYADVTEEEIQGQIQRLWG